MIDVDLTEHISTVVEKGDAMKIVLSADRRDEGAAARRWCTTHLDGLDSVVAVVGVNVANEFVYGVPLFDAMGGIDAIVDDVERNYCEPLIEAGVACQMRLVHHGQVQALIEVAEREHADMIVVGKQRHGAFTDALVGEIASRLVHHPPCPLLVVPVAPAASSSALADA